MVIIEYIDNIDTTKVAVLSYDNYQVGSILEVCSTSEATKNYDVVGELRAGKITEYDSDDYDDNDYFSDSYINEEYDE